MTVLRELGLTMPVLAAPMAGGPTTPDVVLAAAGEGSLGLLAAGYKTAEELASQVEAVRYGVWGVNLFAPNPVPVDRQEYTRYRTALMREADRLGVALPDQPVENDDHWRDKIDLLLDVPAPVVSFTFGIPDAAVLSALRRAGSLLAQTVTSTAEATLAVEAGVDVLIVQASAAGGHSGTLTPLRPVPQTPLTDLLTEISAVSGLPIVAAGGITDAHAVADALQHGAEAVAVGTALLLAPEAGTSDAYRAALRQHESRDTVVTRAFTGRPARGIVNTFLDRYDADAPSGYPALHYLTSPLRKASAAAGDPEFVNLWAGTGWREVVERPAGETLRALTKRA